MYIRQVFSRPRPYVKAVLAAASGSRKGKQNAHFKDRGESERGAGPAHGSAGSHGFSMSFPNMFMSMLQIYENKIVWFNSSASVL